MDIARHKQLSDELVIKRLARAEHEQIKSKSGVELDDNLPLITINKLERVNTNEAIEQNTISDQNIDDDASAF